MNTKHIFLFFILSLILKTAFAQEVKLGLPVGHMSYINDGEFSPDNRLIVTSSLEPTSRIWDAHSGKLLHTLKGHRDNIRSAKFNSTGQLVVTASDDSTAKIWDVKTGILLYTLVGHRDQVVDAKFSPDNKIIATTSWDGSILLWNVTTGERIKTIFQQHHGSLARKIEFSSDSKYLLSVHVDDTIRVWALKKNKLFMEFEGGQAKFSNSSKFIIIQNKLNETIYSLQNKKKKFETPAHIESIIDFDFSFDDKYLLTAYEDSSMKVWNLVEKKLDKLIPFNSAFRVTKFNHLNYSIVSGMENGELLVWDAENGILKDAYSINHTVHYENTHRQVGIDKISVSPDGKSILVMASVLTVAELESNKVIVFDIIQGNEKFILNGHTSRIQNPGLSDNGQFLAMTLEEPIVSFSKIAPVDQLIPVYEIQTGKYLDNLRDINLGQLNTSFTFEEDETPRINMLKTNNFFDFIPSRPQMGYFVKSPDGRYLAFESKNVIELWNLQQKVLVQRILGHEQYVNFLAFSKDSKFLASCSFDGTTRIWDIASAELKLRLNIRPNSIAFSPDNKNVLIEITDQTAEIRAVADGKLICELKESPLGISRTFYIFDGSKVLTTSWDGSWSIWNAQTGEQLIRHLIFDSDPNKWEHLHPSGLFDASPEAMELMYWTKGLNVVEFSKLKDVYWEPNLWEKVMNGETLRKVSDIQNLKLAPKISLGEEKAGVVPIKLENVEGGYGTVSVFLNGKEVVYDAREKGFDAAADQNVILFDVKKYDSHLISGTNILKVEAKGLEKGLESVSSTNSAEITFQSSNEKQGISFTTKNPHFYAVVIGTSHYDNSDLDLDFPEKDAQSISNALTLGSLDYFTKNRTHIYTLTTSDSSKMVGNLPSKSRIKEVFEEIAARSTSNDILLIYLSGHGISWENDFHYLTTHSKSKSMAEWNAQSIEAFTISMNEFREWMRPIPANKRICILDACESGTAVNNDVIASKSADPAIQHAIRYSGSKTGTYTLAGCASNSASYESSLFGQSLLTYAVLEAIKEGNGLEGELYDVRKIFSYAEKKVPELAKELGGNKIQTPKISESTDGTIYFGSLKDENRKLIQLNSPKPKFAPSDFQNLEFAEDNLDLEYEVNKRLAFKSKYEDMNFVFFPDAKFDATTYYKLSGGYTQSNGTITLKLKIKGPKESEHQLFGKTKEELIQQIMELVESLE